MTLKKASNVQEIRGRFENWNNEGDRGRENVIIPLGKPPQLCDHPDTRHRSFSVFAKGPDLSTDDVLVRNNSLHQRSRTTRKPQFAEKQKLVESIVANIKGSSNEKQRSKGYRTVLNSLFDKDLMSLTRVKRQVTNNEERNATETKYNYGYYGKNQKRVAENASYNQTHYNNYKGSEANNNFRVKHTDNNKSKSIYDNITDKYINNLNLDEASTNQKLVTKHKLNSFPIKSEPLQSVYEYYDEPLRPPRRRTTRKKCSAPSRPNSNPNNASHLRQVSFTGTDQVSASSHHNLSALHSDSMPNLDSMNDRRNSAGDLYPLNQGKETLANYHRTPFSDFPSYNGNCPDDGCSLLRHVHNNQGAPQQQEEDMPPGPPPRKPPRTFAHDIYRQNKQVNRAKSKAEIDALYAKPMKKAKKGPPKPFNLDKTVSFVYGTLRNGSILKPPIAPKPINVNYKRYSVIEPIESPRNDCDTSTLKRNGSFRFSFRKPNSSSPRASKQIARLKEAVRNFHFKRDNIGNASQLSKSVEHLNTNKRVLQQEDDHIYAIPQYNVTKPRKEESQELHYMCSPLFPMENAEKQSEQGTGVTQKAKLDWGGLKREFRQSCRLVQKRIKGVVG